MPSLAALPWGGHSLGNRSPSRQAECSVSAGDCTASLPLVTRVVHPPPQAWSLCSLMAWVWGPPFPGVWQAMIEHLCKARADQQHDQGSVCRQWPPTGEDGGDQVRRPCLSIHPALQGSCSCLTSLHVALVLSSSEYGKKYNRLCSSVWTITVAVASSCLSA